MKCSDCMVAFEPRISPMIKESELYPCICYLTGVVNDAREQKLTKVQVLAECFTMFRYCPECGERIDWEAIGKDIC